MGITGAQRRWTIVMIGAAISGLGLLAWERSKQLASIAYYAKRAELPSNLNAIKTAQLGYYAAFDTFVACGSRETAEAHLRSGNSKAARDWREHDGAGGCWFELGWEPDGPIRGAYWVEVSDGGEHFTAWAISDIDADGELAVYRTSDTEDTVFVTDDPDVL